MQVVGNGFSAKPAQCVLYSALSADSTSRRQIQSGLVRCNGSSLAGTCPDGRTFVERYNGSSYFCTPGYAFTNNTAYDATTYRQGTSTTFTGHISGATSEQSGFGLSDTIYAMAWGEATGGTSCPSPSKGTFNSWKRFVTGTGWVPVTGSSIYRGYGFGAARCWPTVSGTASDGGFYVD